MINFSNTNLLGRLLLVGARLRVAEDSDADDRHLAEQPLLRVCARRARVEDVDEAEDRHVACVVRLALLEVDQILGTVVRAQLVRTQTRA